MKGIIILVSIVVFAVPAFAVTYEWVDANGTVNFTEDLGNVPKKFRKRAKILGSEEAATPQVTEVDEAKGNSTGGDGKAVAKEEPPAKGKKTEKTLYDGKEESAWKTEHAKLAADVQVSEDQLEQLNARLADTSKMSRSEYLSIQQTIKNTQVRLQQQQKKTAGF